MWYFAFKWNFISSLSFDFKLNFKQKLNFYFICYFKCVCKVILKNINIFRANYNHEIHIFLKVNIKLLIKKKWNTIFRVLHKKNLKGPALSCYWRNKIKIKNLNGPALSSHTERTGAEVGFFKHGGCVLKCLTTHLDIDVSVS